MAAILIVEEDGLAARHMARVLCDAGHTALLARDGRSALREAASGPDLVLLDLRLPDLPGSEVLARLKRQPETSRIPVLVVTGKAGAAALLGGDMKEGAATVLLKPVADAELLRAVRLALAHGQAWDAEAVWMARQRQQELIWRLIIEGPDPFVLQVCRRLSLDRGVWTAPHPTSALGWPEIAEWGKREGLLDEEQARLLERVPLPRPEQAVKGRA